MVVLPVTLATAQYTGNYQMASFGYAYGQTPTGTNVADANAAYESWKTNFVTSSQGCGYRRVIFDFYSGGLGKTDKSQTVSEGIGYGMLLAAYRGDRSLFDDLWGYYKSKRNSNGVMNWKIENCGTVGANGASDAELDVAMSLIIASEQWQTDAYLSDAKSLIQIIRTKEFEGNVLKPGDQFGGASLTNPSYFSPAYYRVFKTYDGNASFWDAAAASGYTTIAGSPGASRGLVPDWSTSAGGYASAAGQYTDQGKSFFFDAIRTPFRSALDYLWHGPTTAASALTYLNKFNTWAMSAHSNNIANTGSKYDMSGNKTQVYHNACFSACFSVAAMAGGSATQAYLNTGYNDLKNVSVGNGEYFNATFKALGLFVMTGNYYLPKQCTNKPSLGADKSLCSGASATLSTTSVSGATYSWKKDGVAISGSSNSINATSAGEYELTLVSGSPACAARDKVVLFGSTISADFIATSGAGKLIVTNNSLGGVSNFKYTITGPSTVPAQTTADFELTGLLNGKYTIKLDIDNKGFSGCSATSTVTKTVSLGDGVGMVADDFVYANSQGFYPYTTGTKIKPIEKVYCSKADADANATKDCPSFPCGNWVMDFGGSGGASQYDLAGIDFGGDAKAPYDLTKVPQVQIRAWASAPIKIYVKLNQKTSAIDFSNASSTANEISLTTTPTVFNLDFAQLLSGWDNKASKAATITAWNSVTGVSFFPFDNGTAKINATFNGTITFDYIIVGAKGIPAPNFSTKLDAFGYTDYGVYLKDYYPNDPKYSDCTVSTEGSACYGSVPDWKKDASMCGTTAVALKANSCTATEIRWYKVGSTALLGTGATYSATTGGKYYVELSNSGGVTRDTVEVKARAVSASIDVIKQDNFNVNFANTGRDFDSWVWNFGETPAVYIDGTSGVDQTTVWDPTYYGYTSEGAKTVTLTVTDAVCNKTATATKALTIVCNGPAAVALTGPTKTAFCSGEKATYTVVKPEYTSSFAWFFPLNTTEVFNEDSTSVELTYGLNSSGPVEYQAYGSCLDKKSSKIISVTVTDPVDASFTKVDQVDDKVFLKEATKNAETIVWTFPAGSSSLTSTEAEPVVSLKGIGTKKVCLKADNATCNTTDTKCLDIQVTLVGVSSNDLSVKFVAFPNPANGGNVEFSMTIKNVVVMDALGNEVSKASSLNKLDVSSYKSGIYFVKSDQGTARIVIQ